MNPATLETWYYIVSGLAVKGLNRVPVSAGGKGGILTSAGWQVTLCGPIWHVSFLQR